MNLKDIFTEYAKQQRELVLKAYLSSKYFDEEDAILNAPEPPLPNFWTKEKPEPQEGLLATALKIGKGWLYNIYEIEKIDTQATCCWIVWDGKEWEDYYVLRADLYMILPRVEKESKK